MPGHATRTVLVDATGQTPVTVDSSGNMSAVLAAGTAAVGTVTAVGAAAHDAGISGAPVRVGARALTADYAAVATGDAADLKATTVGALVVKQDALPELEWSYAAATGGIDNSSTAVTVKTAAGAGVRNYVKSIQIAHATLGASTEFGIRDGAGGTVLWRTLLHTTAMPSTTFTFANPLRGSANTLLEVVTLTAVTGDVLVNCQGHAAP